MNDRATQLANSFARAKKLTEVVASPEFDKYAHNLRESGFVDSDILSEDYKPQNMLPYNPNSIPPTGSVPYDAHAAMQRIQQAPPIRNNIGLPKQILDEIQKNPLNGISSDPTMDAFANTLASNIVPQQKKPTLTEQLTQQPQLNQVVNNSNFDYETMKMIIEGVVKKYIDPLKENILNESVNKDNGASLKMMKLGKNFQFMDSSGNIYEATMTYKGNIKDMKNKKPVK